MSSYRRYVTHKDAAERAMRQVLRHRMETGPFDWIVKPPAAVEALTRGLESLRASLENWPVPPPLFRSQALPQNHDVAGCTGAWNQYRSGRRKCSDCGEEMNSVQCPAGDGHAVMMNGHCAVCSYVDPSPEPRVVGYRDTRGSSILRCLDHPPYGGYEIPVTSEELENGGICTWCGNDVLAHPGVNQ